MPERLRKLLNLLLASTMLLPSGCFSKSPRAFKANVPPGTYEEVASQIDYPAESSCTQMNADESLASPHPWTIQTEGTPEYWDMSLEETIQLTLQNSRVLHDLGGAVVRSPGTTRTTLDPAVAETDPRTGIEAALSHHQAAINDITTCLEHGTLRHPTIHRFGLEEIVTAHEGVESGQIIGKAMVALV
jgi:hypothetical protein